MVVNFVNFNSNTAGINVTPGDGPKGQTHHVAAIKGSAVKRTFLLGWFTFAAVICCLYRK